MTADEAKALTLKAQEAKINAFRADVLKRIEAQANIGEDSLYLNNTLNKEDMIYFGSLGYSITEHKSATVWTNQNDPIIYVSSVIRW